MERIGSARPQPTWSIVVGVFLILLMAVVVVAALVWMGAFLTALPPVAAAPIVAGLLTVFVAVASLLFNQWAQRRSERDKAQLAKKSEFYEKFIADIMLVLNVAKEPRTEAQTSEHMVTAVKDFTSKAIVWGSPEVIQAWLNFKTQAILASEAKDKHLSTMDSLERLFRAIRRDLGYDDRKLAQQDLLKLFITDL